MLRITSRAPAQLDLEGRLVGPWIAELARVIAESTPPPTTLDLSGLTFADREGLAFLRACRERSMTLVGASAFIAHLLGP